MKNTIIPVLMAGLLLSGCSSIPVSVTDMRVSGDTFSFIKPISGVAAGQSEAHSYNSTIQAAIKEYLVAKGIKYVQSGGDLTVGYIIVVRSAVTTSAMSNFYGHGPEAEKMLKRAHKGADKLYEELEKSRMIDAANTSVGAMVVDIMDSTEFDLRYREFAVRAMVKTPTDAERKARIKEVIDDIFSDL